MVWTARRGLTGSLQRRVACSQSRLKSHRSAETTRLCHWRFDSRAQCVSATLLKVKKEGEAAQKAFNPAVRCPDLPETSKPCSRIGISKKRHASRRS